MLGFALEGFESLRSSSTQTRGQNADAHLSGGEIVRRFGDGSLEFKCMGRQGGRYGAELSGDLATGRWRTVIYQVRGDPEPINPNWFPIAEFVAAIPSAHQSDSPAVTRVPTKSKMLGAQILREYERGSLWYKTVGRNGGLVGTWFSEDVRSGRWNAHKYEVSTSPNPENRNWFLVEDFARSVTHR
jgi:hypothetical protein